jgi:type I restriction enzyme R subunit
MQGRLEKGRERLDNALDEISLLCEPIKDKNNTEQSIKFFCGNTEIESDLKAKEFLRTRLYKNTVSLIQAYANICRRTW